MGVLCAAWGAEPAENGQPPNINIDRTIELFSHAMKSKDQHIVLARAISMEEARRKLGVDSIELSKHENLLNKGYSFYFFEVTAAVTGFTKIFFYPASPAQRSKLQPDIGDSDLYPADGTSWLLVIKPTDAIAQGNDVTMVTLPDIYDGAIAAKDDNRLQVDIPSFVEDLKNIKNSLGKDMPKKPPVLKTSLAESILNKVRAKP